MNTQKINRKIWKKEVANLNENGWKYCDKTDKVLYNGKEFGSLIDFLIASPYKIQSFVLKANLEKQNENI